MSCEAPLDGGASISIWIAFVPWSFCTVTATRYCGLATQAEIALFTPFIFELLDASFAEIASRFLQGIEVDDKDNGTPVTQADKRAEAAMRSLIESRFPEHGIFGEEYGIKEGTECEGVRYRWILDPVDGTRSFITNSFLFGTLIALERDDGAGFRPILSSLSHPAARVRTIGSLAGTTLYYDNGLKSVQRKLHVRACKQLSQATLLTTSHWTTPEQKGDESMQTLIDSVKLYRTFGDCFGYFAVASGGADIMIDPDLSYWDVAALLPVVEGAGGTLTSLTGGNPLKDLSAVCTAGDIHGEVIAILNR